MDYLQKIFRIFMLLILSNFLCINYIYPYDIKGNITTEFENFDYKFPTDSFISINGQLKSTSIGQDGHFIFHDIPEGLYTLTIVIPGFENKEIEIDVPLKEDLNIILELPVEELEPIIITAKKEEWENTLERLLKHDPNSSDTEPDSGNDYSDYQGEQEAGAGGMPILAPIFMLIKWLKKNF